MALPAIYTQAFNLLSDFFSKTRGIQASPGYTSQLSFKPDCKTVLILIIIFCASIIYSQNTFTLTGRVFNRENKEILPFATVYNADGYSISNEDGVFELKLKRPAKWIKVRYTGFKHDSIMLDENATRIDLYLTPQPNLLNDVVVTAKTGNFRYNLFLKAIESYFKTGIKEVPCKSYYRTYTLLNSASPAELFESFYNITCSGQEIKDLKLKGGRFLLPRNKTFINLASAVLIEAFKPCENAQNLFPFSPLQCATVMHLKNRYVITIKNIIKTENDTLYHFTFSATDTSSFSGELFYFKRQNRVGKIKLHAASVTDHPLYSMRDPGKDKISHLKYDIEIGYVLHKNKNLISYINFDMNFNLKTGQKTDLVQTNMKVINFDYDKSFFLPVYPEKIEFKFDYEKVAAFPYNAGLFENNMFIKEGTNEILIRKLFDTIRCYNSMSLDESILFLPKRFQRWNPEWALDDDLLREDYMPEAHLIYGNNYSKSKKAQWDSAFAYTFIFLDYDCYDKSPAFSTNGVLDYKYSFLMAKNESKNDSVNRDYLKLYLDNCHSISVTFKEFLEKKYQNRCPLEEELKEDYKKFASLNITEMYLIHAAGNSPNKEQAYFALKDRLMNRKVLIK